MNTFGRKLVLLMLLAAMHPSAGASVLAGQVGTPLSHAVDGPDDHRAVGSPARADTTLADTLSSAETLVKDSRAKQLKGDFFGAIADLYKALRIYETVQDQDGMAEVYNAIGTIHHYDHNYKQARSFYDRSLKIRQQQGRKQEIAILYGNIGSLLEVMGHPDSALAYHRRNLQLRRQQGAGPWLAICYANLGACYGKLGQRDSALHYLRHSLELVRTSGGPRLRGSVLAMLGQAELEGGAFTHAVGHCEEALKLARQTGALPGVEAGLDCLYQAYSAMDRPRQALATLQELVAVRDSMFGKERTKGLLKVELDYAHERQHFADSLVAVDQERKAQFAYLQGLLKERNQKRLLFLAALAVVGVAFALWSRLRFMQRSRNRIRHEMDRSEALLLNILPRPIAVELKRNGRVVAREIAGVSILFTDFHEFTKLSERMSAQDLVEGIDVCYRAFDDIASRHGLEKIKTIGDAYMCAGGLPAPQQGSVRSTVLAALDMQAWISGNCQERERMGRPGFRMRAGIHTGTVVAGVVGQAKFQYDVWGDTVNTAARFVSAGEVGEVNVSEVTRSRLHGDADFTFIARGKIMAKGKGEMEMFFVRLAAADPPGNGDGQAGRLASVSRGG